MKRIKYNGRSLSRFDMAYIMGNYRHLPWTVMYDAYSYSEMVSFFSDFLASKGESLNG